MASNFVKSLKTGAAPRLRSGGLGSALRTYWPEMIVAILLAASFFALRDMVLSHDVVWQLWIGRQLSHGAVLYADILELNPPLWFWIAAPITSAAEALGITASRALIIFFLGSTALSLSLSSFLIKEKPPLERVALLIAMLAVLALISLNEFGQREQFTLIGSLPYVVLISRRIEGLATPGWTIAAVGAFAAIGLALKHYFVLMPIALEIMLLLHARRRWTPFRLETGILGVAAATYVTAIMLVAPEFLETIVPMVALAYGDYGLPFLEQLDQPVFPVLFLSLAAFRLYGFPRSNLARSAAAACAAFLLAYFLQQKGWRYHTLPAFGFLMLAVVAELSSRPRGEWRPLALRQRAVLGLFFAALILALVSAVANGRYVNDHRDATARALAGLESGQAVLALTDNALSLWPMLEERQLVWPSRHFVFWMLPTIAKSERDRRSSPELRQMATQIRLQTADDMACVPPARIFVDNHQGSNAFRGLSFDTLRFFNAEPRFAAIFSSYEKGPKIGRLQVYERVRPVSVIMPPYCRRIH